MTHSVRSIIEVTLALIVVFTASCAGDSSGEPPDCSSAADCPSGYACQQERCIWPEDNPPCDATAASIDQDGDGYGRGSNRQSCVGACLAWGAENCDRFAVPDCDDTDPDVYPDAPEICDGVANDCSSNAPADQNCVDASG